MKLDLLKKYLRAVAEILEDFIFPPEIAVGEIEKLSAAGLVARAKRPIESPTSFIFPIFDYKNPTIRTAVWQIKYRGNRRIAKLFGEVLAQEILAYTAEYGETLNFTKPVLVPIPISKERRRTRGRNQCELLAEAALECLDTKYFGYDKSSLVKNKHTLPQTKTKSRAKRLSNLRDSFAVTNAAALAGRNVILIDDVTTTGSTITEAARILKSAGARRVIAFTMAH